MRCGVTHFSDLQESRYVVGALQELFVNLQRFLAVLFIHVEEFLCKNDGRLAQKRRRRRRTGQQQVPRELTQQVDDTVIVAGEQSNEVFGQENKTAIDDAIGKFIGLDLG